MEVETMEIPKETAQQEYEAYLKACKKTSHPYYNKMKSIYYQVKQTGLPVLDVEEVILKAGLNEHNQPKFAIARADMSTVGFVKGWDRNDDLVYKFVEITKKWRRRIDNSTQIFKVPASLGDKIETDLETTVPKIPPQHLPDKKLHRYHVLWEVKNWRKIPKDPILLKQIPDTNNLFMVLAQWDLTELERKVLADVVRV